MRAFIALATLLVVACAPRNTATVAPRGDSMITEAVARGVRYDLHSLSAWPQQIHELTIDPRACGIDFRSIKAGDHVTGRETPLLMAQRTARTLGRPVLGAINADFFAYDPPGVSEGPQISDGMLLKSAGTHREALDDRLVKQQPVFAFTADRKRVLTSTRFRGTAVSKSGATPLAGVNVRTRADSAVLFDSFWGSTTPADTGAVEVIIRQSNGARGLSRNGVVIGSDTMAAGVAIPDDGFVLVARGQAARTLATLSTGDTVRVSASFDAVPANVRELVGGYPLLLVHGRQVHHDEAGLRPGFSDRRHPRSAIAWSSDRNIHLFVVDGRRPGVSEGMSLQELADYLLSRGFSEAMNFDGGGSSTLVVNGRITNQPSDTTGERAVSNALLVLGPKPGTCK